MNQKVKRLKLYKSRFVKFFKEKKWLILSISAGVIVLATISTAFLLKTASAVQTNFVAADHPIDQPFVVELNQTLRDIDVSKIKISPEISGEWSFNSGKFLSNDQLTFTPEKDFKVDTTYTVNIGEISRLLFGDHEIPALSFTTEKAPGLVSDRLVSLADGATIAADYMFEASLSASANKKRQLQLRVEPAIELELSSYDDQEHYVWKPKDLLPQGQNLQVEIYDEKNEVSMMKKTVHVADQPSLAAAVPATNFGQNDVAKIVFNQPIDVDSARIEFNVKGSGSWVSDSEYNFKPDSVEPGKTYSYHIKSGLRSKDGGILLDDIDLNFSTVGARVVTSSSPRGNELNPASQQIKFTFSGPVNHQSAEAHFSVDRGTVVGFSWSGNTLIATVNDLGFQQTVNATMAAGVLNEGFGLPTAQGYGVRFTTEIRSVKLGVPAYRQTFAQSCEESSLRMALAYRGIATSDEALLHQVGYSGQESRRDAAGGIVWEDPNDKFVGSVHGSQANLTGYGVFAGPIARVARAHGRGAEAQYGVNAAWVAQQIHNNNPVILWGSYGASATRIAWTTPDGNVVNAPMPTHTRIVVGVKGEPSAPLGFWINDPASGRQVYWSTAQMIGDSQRGANQAVAVY